MPQKRGYFAKATSILFPTALADFQTPLPIRGSATYRRSSAISCSSLNSSMSWQATVAIETLVVTDSSGSTVGVNKALSMAVLIALLN